ncbi:amino acid/amide ABC transporter membrane protein 1 (HAAT family) [Rhodobacter sp. JA431]|uniref:urea ABC transporter permease subunit UrtB n=1 Tax=Rhodobacter sp. JA431 TaxID=570013 RepID=UPI000BC9AC46|nr:urea ABC transporter permease subunit UrtB [Rhodobacter sp. JA431]SOB90259.1 amino acid/amide ABC transporter membrane protein 1 (HAAT family) [Rhodobacter sp. JA431]
MRRLLLALAASFALAMPVHAQEAPPQSPVTAEAPLTGLAAVIAENAKSIAKPSRKTIGPIIAAIGAAGPGAPEFLEAWADKRLGERKTDNGIFLVERKGSVYLLSDPVTGALMGEAPRKEISEIKPNAGVRGLIAAALIEFQLSDANIAKRRAALVALSRDGGAEHLAPLAASIPTEPDAEIKAEKERLLGLLTIRYGESSADRVAAIESFGADLGLDFRASLNPLLATTRRAFEGAPEGNVAQELRPGKPGFTAEEAYDLLVAENRAPARLTRADLRAALEAHIENGAVAGIPLAELDTPARRDEAYDALEAAGLVPAAATDAEVAETVAAHRYAEIYAEPDAAVTTAAAAALKSVSFKVEAMQGADLALDALSLASIYFLAAIGLAVTFGVMRVINMAHGEFITMGAYTGYVVQLYISDYTLSILVALPLAFAVTFAAGVAMERLVIRHLVRRPLETLLATFGISIALQQLFKNIFGTQARPLTAPEWLDGAWVLNDIVGISYIRIAIFVLALIFLGLFLFVMSRTRLGLEVRAVTQNPSMAASMGINPDKINMLTFGLGSGIAGIAGVAIGLFAKVTSELGADYIVQSFMTVVVGGVGNIWGTLAGASLVGGLQKGIEALNPSNTLAAQTYMILFIIIFIQFRPRGIIALKGRAAGD